MHRIQSIEIHQALESKAFQNQTRDQNLTVSKKCIKLSFKAPKQCNHIQPFTKHIILVKTK